jgi:predicted SnoaL-like aldol condensation-catalyzing enzyme
MGKWIVMSSQSPDENKSLVIRAFNLLFNERDYVRAVEFWSPHYIQHSAHIPPGRDGLFNLVRALPDTLRYEHGLILSEGDFVMVHGRYSGTGGPTWVGVDIIRFADGLFAEHWDVLQDEATEAQSKSGRPMFGDCFPK